VSPADQAYVDHLLEQLARIQSRRSLALGAEACMVAAVINEIRARYGLPPV
jgi:hypothetical protein